MDVLIYFSYVSIAFIYYGVRKYLSWVINWELPFLVVTVRRRLRILAGPSVRSLR